MSTNSPNLFIHELRDLKQKQAKETAARFDKWLQPPRSR